MQPMEKNQFVELFHQATSIALANAAKNLGRDIPSSVKFKVYGQGSSGEIAATGQVVELLYISSDRFYAIIDLAVIEVHPDYTLLFLRISRHQPVPFEKTWNDPIGSGPFKQILSETIAIISG